MDRTKSRFKCIPGAKLNSRQLEAVEAGDGYQLVLATAGAGKTRTLIHRLAALVHAGVSPDRILLMTFTRKAAEEMKTRSIELLDNRCKNVFCGTFHSFSLHVLKNYYEVIGYPKKFQIIDDREEIKLLQGIIEEKDSKYINANTAREVFGLHINTGRSIKSVCKYGFSGLDDNQGRLYAKLHKGFMKYKKKLGMVGFDDMLLLTFQALEDNDTREELSSQFKYILVDELQDTNPIQMKIARALCSKHENLTGVGDTAQSIYRFRGADVKNIIQFEKEFSPCKVISLEENYRSTAPILNLANAVSESFSDKFEREMFTSRGNSGELPILYRANSEIDQASYVAQSIQRALKRDRIPIYECAVLFRANSSALSIQHALDVLRIPYHSPGDNNFFDKPHIKDILAYLRLSRFPQDPLAWSQVLQMHPGIGPRKIEDISHAAQAGSGLKALKLLKGSKVESISRQLYGALQNIRTTKKPTDTLQVAWRYAKPLMQNQYKKSTMNFDLRIRDVGYLIERASAYSSVPNMLLDIKLDPLTEKEVNGVTLSSVHGSKGLEFQAVWVINVNEGKFPSSYFAKTSEQIEEERRLFYVAVTRAKTKLTLCSLMSEAEKNAHRQGKKYSYGFDSSLTSKKDPKTSVPRYKDVPYGETGDISRFLSESPKILSSLVQTVHSPELNVSKHHSKIMKEYE